MVDVDPIGVDAKGRQAFALGGDVLGGRRHPVVPDLEFCHRHILAG